MKQFIKGLKSGVPIGLGYLSVSFTFGILAVSYGFSWWQAVVISMTTLTSAGQLAGIGIMVNPGQYIEMLISQLTINVRYSFMSVSLSQKASPELHGWKRWLLGFFITDEIFAVASAEKEVSSIFFLGLSVMPYIGWALGTLFGAVLGNVLPENIMNALCLAIYGMFLAIIAPDMKKSKTLTVTVMIAVFISCLLYFSPISPGLTVSISAVIAAVFGAVFFPVKEESENE